MTLTELMWTIAVIGILAAFALARLDWTRFRLDAEVRSVATQLAYAQRLAVSLQHDVLVTIDRADRRLVIDEDRNNDGGYDPTERRRVIQLADGVAFDRRGAPALPAPSPVVELASIRFRRDGSADQAGVVFVSSERGGRVDVRALELVRATGRPTGYRLQAGAWVRRG